MNKIGKSGLVLLSSLILLAACSPKEDTPVPAEQPAQEKVAKEVIDDEAYIIELANISNLLTQYSALMMMTSLVDGTEGEAEKAQEETKVYLDFIEEEIVAFQESNITTRKYASTLELSESFMDETLVWIRANRDPNMTAEKMKLIEESYTETLLQYHSKLDTLAFSEEEQSAFTAKVEERAAQAEEKLMEKHPEVFSLFEKKLSE